MPRRHLVVTGAGRCINALIGAWTTDLGEGAALHDERVRLVPLAGELAAVPR